MNDFSLRLLDPVTLDELLSADLDGELDAAAADLGFDIEAVRTAIDNDPTALQRRGELASAVGLLEQPPAEASAAGSAFAWR